MKIDQIKRDGNLVSFEVEDSYQELEVFINKKYLELNNKIKLPGFRKGKVPKKLFIKNYGLERLSYEAMIDLLNEKYPKIIAEHNIEVIDYPKDIQVIQMEEDKPLKVKISVEVKPEIKVAKYKGIKLEKEVVKLDKQEVEDEINLFLDRHATYENDPKAKIKKDDLVTFDIEASIEGKSFELWTKKSDSTKVGANKISPDLMNT